MKLWRRGKVWWVYLGVDESGRPIRVSTKCSGKKSEAKKVAEDILALRVKGGGRPTAKRNRGGKFPRPFPIVSRSHVENSLQRGRREESYHRLDPEADPSWVKVFAERDVTEITLEDVEAQLNTWMKDRKWAPATYNGALHQISGVFTYAYRLGWIDRHPLRGRAQALAVDNGRHRYFYPQELSAMQRTASALARTKGHAFQTWLRDIIVVAPMTGIRRRALLDLRCRDVRKDENGRLFLCIGKDKNGRAIQVDAVGEAAEIVRRRLERAEKIAKQAGKPGEEALAYLLPGPDGKNADTAVGRWMPFLIGRLGMRHPEWRLEWGQGRDQVSFHTFRHTMASLALNNGIPKDVVRLMGNWRTEAMVDRYAHRLNQTVRDARDRLAEVLGAGDGSEFRSRATSRRRA